MCPRNEGVPLAKSQAQVIDSANAGCALDNGVEHRLDVGRRAADDAEYLGCRCLMLQRLTQFCVALLQFLEQPDILDGDDSLSGKGFKQFDLLLGERSYLRSANEDGSDRSPLPKQWCS